ncbi:MAG: hypothetical protein L3J74_01570 [Bacteroidales bacterium]|nr:hypothetical protein [Bacteroidales bacterium]
MNIAKAYTKGFIQTAKYPRMWFILYFANLLMALLLALPIFSVLKSNFGHSDFFQQLLAGYDATVFNEFFYYYGDALSAITGGIKWLLLAYFLLSVFLTGGIIRTLNDDRFSTSSFFGGGAYSFFRYLGLSILVALIQIFFLLVIAASVGGYIGSHFSNFQSELTAYYIGIAAAVIYLFIFLIFSMVSDYGKFYLELNDSHNIFKAFWDGIKYVFKHFVKTLSLYLILLFLPAVVMYVYLYFEKDYKMATSIGILIVFLMQQAFIFLRVFLRTWILASELKIYDDDYLKLNEVEEVVQSIVDQKVKEIENKKEIVSESVISREKAENKVLETQKEQNIKDENPSEYQINFEETFAKNENIEEKVLTEEEIMQRMVEEEAGHDEVDIQNQDKNIQEEELGEDEDAKG